MNIKKACAITGHRPKILPWGKEEQDYRCYGLTFELSNQVKYLIDAGVDTFYTGMARGVDIIFGEMIIKLKQKYSHIKLIGMIPYEEQSAKWNIDYRERYFNLAAMCDDVVTINTRYHKNCYKQRNENLVESAEYLIAVYDNRCKRSGTCQTINMARKLNRDIIIINPLTLEVEYIKSKPILAIIK